jgi:hypothetical protein
VTEQQEQYHPWTTVAYAGEEARLRGDRRIGTEHLLLGLIREPELAAALGTDLGGAREALAELDREALAAVGIDPSAEPDAPPPPPAVRRRRRPTVRELTVDRVRLTPAATDALRSSSTGVRRGRRPEARRVLLALLELEPPDPAHALLGAIGVDRGAVRAALEQ